MIDAWLSEHSEQIKAGKIKVFVEDECHLKGGDICGYGWGDRQERLETEVKNYRDSQTYYGAINCLTGEMTLRSYKSANTLSTIQFVQELQSQNPEAKIVLIWDGASHHRSIEFRDFLAQTNQGQEWNIHCLRFAPYAPQENPIENVWGQLKPMLRSLHFWCRSFLLTEKFQILDLEILDYSNSRRIIAPSFNYGTNL